MKYTENVLQSSTLKCDPVLHKISKEAEDCKNIQLVTDRDISLQEVNDACDNLGTGCGLDGLSPVICKLLQRFLNCLGIYLMVITQMIGIINFSLQLLKLVTQ